MPRARLLKKYKYYDFGQLLTKTRIEAGLSQEQVANHLTIKQQSYSRWEIGQSRPRVKDARKLIEFFKISPKDQNRWIRLADYSIAHGIIKKDAIFFSRGQRNEILQILSQISPSWLSREHMQHILIEIENIINLPRISFAEFADFTEAEIEFNGKICVTRIHLSNYMDKPPKGYLEKSIARELLNYVRGLNDQISAG